MKKLLSLVLLATLVTAPITSFGQEQGALPTVSIKADGDDVRSVIHDLFGQAKKNYVLDPGVRFALYLSLKDIEFEEALNLICKNASLAYEVQNGIYFVKRAPSKTEPKVEPKQEPKAPEKPKGKLPESVLTKIVQTKSDKADLRKLFAELGRQAQITIEVDAQVPAYKLDAYLNKTSLKFALTQICDAAKLEYFFTENQTILIRKKGSENRVVLRTEGE